MVVALLSNTVGETAWKAISYLAFGPATEVSATDEFEKRAAKVRVKAHILLNDSSGITKSAGPNRCRGGSAEIWAAIAATIFFWVNSTTSSSLTPDLNLL
jgi:hypothetical protein